MPWKETDAVKQRMLFVADLERDHYSMTELCRRYGVSRKTGYKFLDRFDEHGPEGLRDHSRAPRRCPHRMDATVARDHRSSQVAPVVGTAQVARVAGGAST